MSGYDKYLEYQFHHTGGFYTGLFKLIAIADPDNSARLAEGFPEEVDAVLKWRDEGAGALAKKVTPEHPLLKTLIDEYGLTPDGEEPR